MNLGKLCPDCGSTLGKDAYKCRCGWLMGTESAVTKRLDCWNAPQCTRPATIRVKDGGWKNLCYPCQLGLRNSAANEFCEREGLVTQEQKRAFIAKLLGASVKSFPFMREPGMDDEIDKKLESCGS